jgi:hypothetical protein
MRRYRIYQDWGEGNQLRLRRQNDQKGILDTHDRGTHERFALLILEGQKCNRYADLEDDDVLPKDLSSTTSHHSQYDESFGNYL